MDKNVECPNCQHQFDAPDGAADASSLLPSVAVSDASAKPARTGIGRNRRYTGRGILFRCTLLLMLFACAAGIHFAVIYAVRSPESSASSSKIGASKPATSAQTGGPDQAAAKHSAAAAIDRLERSVVLLESVGAAGDSSLGSGFVIDDSGLIATNYHVVAHATQAFVRFRNGERCRVLGLAAVEPERDLAIIRLESTPLRLVPAPMAGAENPQKMAPVVALGHPNGVAYSPYDGKVSRIVKTSDLPLHSQRFLQRILSGRRDATWIQHTARLSDGNSGGPLLDRHGRVIGINTWVDRQSQFSYALHIKHLHDLRKQTTSETKPLGSATPRDAWVTEWLNELNSARIRQLFDQAAGFRFLPASASEYRHLQKLAWAVTVANSPSSLTLDVELEKQFDELQGETDRVLAKLRKREWNAPAQILLINELAAEHIEQPLSGVFLVGTLLRIVEGSDRSSGALIQISGLEKTFFVPLAGRLFSAPPGTSLLVLGVNYNGRVVRYGDNPLQLKTAPVIVTGALIRMDQ
jgi:S1-C subfamily serine protease